MCDRRGRPIGGDITDAYYYDDSGYDDTESLMAAVRDDIDSCFGDSDLDDFIKMNGGSVESDGTEFHTSLALKKHSTEEYLACRDEAIDTIMGEIREGVELGIFPIQVPYTFNTIESDD